jgi:raffinose/stachyose/melibiose transport system permease protein
MNQSSTGIRQIKMLLTYIFLGIGTLIYIYPMVWLIMNSLKRTSEIFDRPWGIPLEWMWNNYRNAWVIGGTGKYLFNSAFITTVTLVLVLLFSSMAAFALVKLKWKASKGTMVYFLIGFFVPIQATLIPLFVLFSKMNLINTQFGLILIYISGGLPIAIMILSGFMTSIPKELMEAAIMDGCSIYGVYWRVLMPVMKPALMTVGILSFVGIWNELFVALVFLTDQKKMTLPVGLLNFQGQYATEFSQLFAAIVMTTIPTVIVFSIFNKRIISGFTAGSIKG